MTGRTIAASRARHFRRRHIHLQIYDKNEIFLKTKISPQMLFSKPFNLDRTVRLVIGVAIVAVVCYLVDMLSGVLLPFVAAWLFAYMLNPVVDFVQYKMRFKNRLVSVLSVMLLLAAILVGIGAIAASSIESEVLEIQKMSQNYVQSTQKGDSYLPPAVNDLLKQFLGDMDIAEVFSVDNLKALTDDIIPKAFDLVSSSVQWIAGLVVVFFFVLYMFFILMDFHDMSNEWINLIPQNQRKFASLLMNDLGTGMDTYFRRQALISLIVGILFTIGFSIIGLPMSGAMGLLIGLLNMIPYMHTLGIIPPIIVALIQSAQTGESFWMTVLWIVVVFLVIQVIIDGVLTPNIMGRATGLRPAVILLSLSVWGALLGVTGMIIALPVTTLLNSYYQHYFVNDGTVDEMELIKQEKEKEKAERKKKSDSAENNQAK